MKNFNRYCYLSCFFLIMILSFQNVSAEETSNGLDQPVIIVEYFYGETCGTCAEETTPIINQIENEYGSNITLLKLPVDPIKYPENLEKMQGYTFIKNYPAVVIKNLSNTSQLFYFTYADRTFTEDVGYKNIKDVIDYLLGENYTGSFEDTKLSFFGLFNIDTKNYSLPVLTIVLGFLDSLNPCSFFIFLVLLSILLHMQSRKRMLLVAGIFIFFSGFFYFLLMAAILNVFLVIEHQIYVAIIAGGLAIIFGSLNIKDFFLSNQGPSLSIPKEKKSKLFKQIRNLSKISYLPGLIGYTVVLAVSVNTVELLCSLGLPLIYIDILTSYNLPTIQYYSFIAVYNIIYVIPLLILVLVFAIILKHWKLTEWQGALLKLYSGVLMFSLGIILIIDRTILHHIEAFVGLIIISFLTTYIISIIWKKRI